MASQVSNTTKSRTAVPQQLFGRGATNERELGFDHIDSTHFGKAPEATQRVDIQRE